MEMLAMESAQGIRRVVATPHFAARYDRPEAFLEERQRSAEQLRSAMAGRTDLPEIRLGAEVFFFRGISDSEFLPRLAMEGSKCVMIEMPPGPWPEEYFRELGEIRRKQGLTPIIAHIDRYIRPFRTFSIPERLGELPVLVQANGEFFLNRRTGAMALKMLKNGQIHLLGSDCHDLSSRKPNLGDALKRIEDKLGWDALLRMQSLEQVLFDL